MYTIGEVSKMFNLPVSTLRYYDKEGVFPNLKRTSGIRRFSSTEIDALHVIECLKSTGMEIKNIKLFMQWCEEGPTTYEKRRELFETRKEVLEKELKELQKNMAMIKFKCWYYEQALKEGNEENIKKMLPDKLPDDIQILYNLSHDLD